MQQRRLLKEEANVASYAQHTSQANDDHIKKIRQHTLEDMLRGRHSKIIRTLEPLLESGVDIKTSVIVLANAYVETQNQNGFDKVKHHIKAARIRDYLEAKNHYFHERYSQAKMTLLPYLEEEYPPGEILGLLVSCIGEDDPLLDILSEQLSQNAQDFITKYHRRWLEDRTAMEQKYWGIRKPQNLHASLKTDTAFQHLTQ